METGRKNAEMRWLTGVANGGESNAANDDCSGQQTPSKERKFSSLAFS